MRQLVSHILIIGKKIVESIIINYDHYFSQQLIVIESIYGNKICESSLINYDHNFFSAVDCN